MSKDKHGRAYLKTADVRAGMRIQVDGGFTCIPADAKRTIRESIGGLWFKCNDGRHYLDGQIKGRYFNGIYPA